MRDYRPTYFPAVPTIFVSLLNHPRVGEFGLEHVRTLQQRRRAVPGRGDRGVRAPHRPAAERGLRAVGNLAGDALDAAARRSASSGTIGLPFPDTDMKIVDVETGTRELPLGEAGELCICRAAGDEGLLEQARGERAASLRTDADGRIWFHTGDIARMDEDGFTSIVQRKKDMIIVDGFNVYPSEVEVGALHASGGAAGGRRSACPDAYHGEVVKACIALKPGATGDGRRARSRTAGRSLRRVQGAAAASRSATRCR